MTNGKRILSVSYGGGHTRMVLPVLRELQKVRPEFDISVMALSTGAATARAAGFNPLGFRDFLDEDIHQTALAHGKRLAVDHHASHTGILYEESVAYLGLSFLDLELTHGEDEAARIFAENGRSCFLPVSTMARIFAIVKPNMLLTTNSPRAELAARRVARSLSIPSLLLTDLLGKGNFMTDMLVTHHCSASKTAFENHQSHKLIQADHYHLTGNPAMDRSVASINSTERAEWLSDHFPNVAPLSPKVLVAEQYGYMHESEEYYVAFTAEQITENLQGVVKACKHNGAIAMIRPHPSLDTKIYEEICQESDGWAIMADKVDLNPLLDVCGLLISNSSTIMLDSLYRRCPVLVINYPNGGNLVPFDKMGMAQGVDSTCEADLNAAIKRGLTDQMLFKKQHANFIKEFPELPCAPRIAEIICQELDEV